MTNYLPPESQQPPIKTARLTLVPFDPDNDAHCDFVVELYNSPEVVQANAEVRTEIPDRETARRKMRGFQDEQFRSGLGRYIVTLTPLPEEDIKSEERKSTSSSEPKLIGNVGLKSRLPPGPTVADLGFSLLREFWGKGYATEACNGLLDYFEREKGLKEVMGYCNPENENSKNMFRRLGFENRGVRALKGLGGEGIVVNGLVWAKPGMDSDLGVYGISD